MNCQNCQKSKSQSYCVDCSQSLCPTCDQSIHNGGQRLLHFRFPQCFYCKSPISYLCTTCNCQLCSDCGLQHSNHRLLTRQPSRKIGVYWDFASLRPRSQMDASYVLNQIHQNLGQIFFIKTLGDLENRLSREYFNGKAQNLQGRQVSGSEILPFDMTKFGSALSSVVLIVSNIRQFQTKLQAVKQVHPNLQIYISMRILPLQLKALDSEIKPNKRHRTHGIPQVDQVSLQAITRRLLSDQLKNKAYKSLLFHQYYQFMESFSLKYSLERNLVENLIQEAEKAEQLIILSKQLPDQTEYKYVSLKVKNPSLQTLSTVLQSLKQDEMLPTKEAVRSRLKEVFDCKPDNKFFDCLIQIASESFSLFASCELNFDIHPYVDPSGKQTQLIYPKNDYWESYDQFTTPGDVLGVKKTIIWSSFLKCLKSLFDQIQKPAIKGGKYGLAFYIKVRGPPEVRENSLGRISYLIQQAFNQNLIKYRRNFIYWTSKSHPVDIEKRELVKNRLIEVLKMQPEGIVIAQIRKQLNLALGFNFDLAELGYSKLTELLVDMTNVQIIENRNRQMVVLKTNQ